MMLAERLITLVVVITICLLAPVLACVQTGSPGNGLTGLANRCSGTQPANTVGLVQAATSDEAYYDGLPLGFCSCSAANAIDYIYPANTNNADLKFGPGIRCADVAQLCVCDEQCNCYKGYGSLSTQFGQIFTASFCDAGGCHMYGAPNCATFNASDAGLQNIVTGQEFPCSSQVDANRNFLPVGSNSPYFQLYSVSCHGCVNCPTCSGTFTTLPQHT